MGGRAGREVQYIGQAGQGRDTVEKAVKVDGEAQKSGYSGLKEKQKK